MKFKRRLRFFGLSYFSDDIAGTAPEFGFGTLFLALLLSFVFFLCGYLAADTVPFAVHYENALQYKEFVNGAFPDGVTIKNNKASSERRVNTYTDDGDKAEYAKNGYELIIDTRPSDMLIQFEQIAVKGGNGIDYESYLALTQSQKSEYKLETRYTDEELIITDELTEKITAYFNGVSIEGSDGYNANASSAYTKLAADKDKYSQEEYGKELYYLYVQFYYTSVSSVLYGARAPVLRDYYYRNYIAANKSYYLFMFDEMCAGSFKTDGGLPVVFGGYFNKCADGTAEDVGVLIKQVFYDTVAYTFSSYFLSTLFQLPFLIFIPLILTLLLWCAGKIVKNGLNKTFSDCFKTVNGFIWVSALLTALITFVFGFFVAAKAMYYYMSLIFGLLILIRTVIFCVTSVIKNRRPAKAEIMNNDDIFGGKL